MKIAKTGDGDENAMNFKKTMHMQKKVCKKKKKRRIDGKKEKS